MITNVNKIVQIFSDINIRKNIYLPIFTDNLFYRIVSSKLLIFLILEYHKMIIHNCLVLSIFITLWGGVARVRGPVLYGKAKRLFKA